MPKRQPCENSPRSDADLLHDLTQLVAVILSRELAADLAAPPGSADLRRLRDMAGVLQAVQALHGEQASGQDVTVRFVGEAGEAAR